MPLPDYLPYRRKPRRGKFLLLAIAVLLIAGLLILQIPRVNRAVFWRLKIFSTYMSSLIHPVGRLPTPVVNNMDAPPSAEPTATVNLPTITIDPSLIQIPTPIPAPTLQPTPFPAKVTLPQPFYDPVRDKEDFNNCGPATLVLALRYYGWKGDQYDISKVIKPNRDDSNVNVEELVYYVRTQAGWLNAEFRVGGTMNTLRKFLSNGIPVIIEETYTTDRDYLINDDRWTGHYLFITGYDDYAQQVIAQDVLSGPNQMISYGVIEQHWQSFNHVYILVFRPEQAELVRSLLGSDADLKVNRMNALAAAEKETQQNPQNSFAWFNMGSNLVGLERYVEAARAYDKAIEIGLPMRMFRYQFGPFIAYFHSGRNDYLMTLTKYALEITRISEEGMLWRGWAFYRKGDKSAALSFFRDALKVHPEYADALHAIEYVNAN